MPSSRRVVLSRRIDVLAGIVAILAIVWTLFSARGGGHPWPVIGAWVLVAAGVVTGRLATRRHPALPGAGVAAAVSGAVLITLPGVTRVSGGPLGYANANAALCALGAVAAVATATRLPRRADRVAILLVAVLLTVACALTDSTAATLILVATLAVVTAARAGRRLDLVVPAAVAAFSLALGVTAGVALRAEPPTASQAARTELWSHAAELLHDNRLDGVGPGRFAGSSALTSDPDTRHAHNDYLQYAAEQGAVGLFLLLGAVALAYASVWFAYDGTTRTALGAAAITVLLLHGTVDYVLHQPPLLAIAATMVGAATALPASARRRRPPPPTKPPVSPAVIALARGRLGGRR